MSEDVFYFSASENLSSSYCLEDHCIVPNWDIVGVGMLILQDMSAVLVQKESWWMWELIPGNSLKSLLGTPTQNGSGFSLVFPNENFLQANPKAAINHERHRDLCMRSWSEYGNWLM